MGTKANGGSWPASVRSPAVSLSDLRLLCHFEGIVDLNAQVSNGAFQPIDCSQ
jgi:hypothetical protein